MKDEWKKYFAPKRAPVGPPVSEEDFEIDKRMIEGFCSYQSGSHGQKAIEKLKNKLPQGTIFVVAPKYSMVQDFGRVIHRKVQWVSEIRYLRGLKIDAIVVLGDPPIHDDHASVRYYEVIRYMQELASRHGMQVWRIREWRFSDD